MTKNLHEGFQSERTREIERESEVGGRRLYVHERMSVLELGFDGDVQEGGGLMAGYHDDGGGEGGREGKEAEQD